jgi:hypothetical protein
LRDWPDPVFPDRPAVHLAKFDLGIIQLGNDTIPVGDREFPPIAVDKHGANTQRPTDPGAKHDPVLPPPELCVKALVAGADAYAPRELPLIHSGKNVLAGLPIADFG